MRLLVALCAGGRAQGTPLRVVMFKNEDAAGREGTPTGAEHGEWQVEAVGPAATQREVRVVGNLGRHPLVGRQVGRVGNENVHHRLGSVGAQVGVHERDAGTRGEIRPATLGVHVREGEGLRTQIDANDHGARDFGGDSEGDRSRAGAEIEDARRGASPERRVDRDAGDEFRFGPHDEGALIAHEREAAKGHLAEYVLQGPSREPCGDKLPACRDVPRAQLLDKQRFVPKHVARDLSGLSAR